VVNAYWLCRCPQPRRRDHDWEALHEITEGPVGLAAGANDHRRTKVGQWRAFRPQDAGRLVATSQVLRRGPIAQTTEVDDSTHSLAAGHLREGMCRPSLFLGEVALATTPHSVHQVVGDVDVTTRAFQGGGL